MRNTCNLSKEPLSFITPLIQGRPLVHCSSNEDPRRGCGRQEQYTLCLAKPLTSIHNKTLCPVTSIDNAPFVPNNETHCSQIAAPRSPGDLSPILLLRTGLDLPLPECSVGLPLETETSSASRPGIGEV